jgi:hypothetical protein
MITRIDMFPHPTYLVVKQHIYLGLEERLIDFFKIIFLTCAALLTANLWKAPCALGDRAKN